MLSPMTCPLPAPMNLSLHHGSTRLLSPQTGHFRIASRSTRRTSGLNLWVCNVSLTSFAVIDHFADQPDNLLPKESFLPRYQYESPNEDKDSTGAQANVGFFGGYNVEESPSPYHRPITDQESSFGDVPEGCEHVPEQRQLSNEFTTASGHGREDYTPAVDQVDNNAQEAHVQPHADDKIFMNPTITTSKLRKGTRIKSTTQGFIDRRQGKAKKRPSLTIDTSRTSFKCESPCCGLPCLY